MKLDVIREFIDSLTHLVLREETWNFNSQCGPEALIGRLRVEGEQGSSSQWSPNRLRILRSGKEFIGDIREDKIEVFRRVGPISWLTGNTMFYFSGQVKGMPTGSEIRGKYLMHRSMRLYFMFAVVMSCLIAVGVLVVSVLRVMRQFIGPTPADYGEVAASSILIVATMFFIFGGYAFFGFFKVMDQENRNALYSFLLRITADK